MRTPRTRALVAALLLAATLTAGCEQEPSTTTDAGEEPTLPGEPGAPDAEPSPGTEDVPDAADPAATEDDADG